MTFGTDNYKIIKRVVSPVFIDMMNIKFPFCCLTDRTFMFKFVKSQTSIRPFTIFIKNAINSKILSFSKFSHALFRTKARFKSIGHYFIRRFAYYAYLLNPLTGIFSFHGFFKKSVLTFFRAAFSMRPRWENKKFFITLLTNKLNFLTHKINYRRCG